MESGLTPISKIDRDFVGLNAKTSGRIINIKTHPDGHLFLKVKDDSGGVISAPIFASLNSKLEEKIELTDYIQLKGEIKNYRGDLEILPNNVEDIKIVHSAPTDISRITGRWLGNPVKIRGTVVEKEKLVGGGFELILARKKDNLKIYIPESKAKKDKLDDVNLTNIIQTAGTVQKYKGKLEIKVNDPHNFHVIEEPR